LLEDALGFTDYSYRQKQKILKDIDELYYDFEFNDEFFLKKRVL
jgi:hypothetical protein